MIKLGKDANKERKEMTDTVETYLGTILHNDLTLIQGIAEKLTPERATLETRGQLLAIKTALDSAMQQLDSLVEFLALIEIVEDGDLTVNDEGWELDTTKKATEKLNGKKTMFI